MNLINILTEPETLNFAEGMALRQKSWPMIAITDYYSVEDLTLITDQV